MTPPVACCLSRAPLGAKMQKIGVAKKKVSYKIEMVDVVTFRLINPSQGKLNELPCSGCGQQVGSERPLAIVWDGSRSYRMCRKCSAHLTMLAPDKGQAAVNSSNSVGSAPCG